MPAVTPAALAPALAEDCHPGRSPESLEATGQSTRVPSRATLKPGTSSTYRPGLGMPRPRMDTLCACLYFEPESSRRHFNTLLKACFRCQS